MCVCVLLGECTHKISCWILHSTELNSIKICQTERHAYTHIHTQTITLKALYSSYLQLHDAVKVAIKPMHLNDTNFLHICIPVAQYGSNNRIRQCERGNTEKFCGNFSFHPQVVCCFTFWFAHYYFDILSVRFNSCGRYLLQFFFWCYLCFLVL